MLLLQQVTQDPGQAMLLLSTKDRMCSRLGPNSDPVLKGEFSFSIQPPMTRTVCLWDGRVLAEFSLLSERGQWLYTLILESKRLNSGAPGLAAYH